MRHWLTRLSQERPKASNAKSTRKKTLRVEPLEQRQLLAKTYFVDGIGGDGPGGSDLNNGTSEATAFASIQRAANFARSGDIVKIRGGVYREDIAPLRSGVDGSPITYEAFNNESVVISGAEQVTGWVPVGGMTDVWVATVNWNANNDRDANTMFVNGELKHEARHFADTDILDFDDWGELPKNGSLQTNGNSFRAPDISGFGNDYWNGAKVRFHTHDWVITTRTITDYVSSNGTIVFDPPLSTISQKQDNGFYIFDTIKALDQPGEWYKGKAEDGAGEENKLYYKAEAGQDPNALDIEFKERAYGFDLSDRDYITIRGIEFRGASVLIASNSDNNTIESNVFHGYNKDSFGRFFLNGTNNVIRDNEIYDSFISAISLDGTRNDVVNNYIHDIGFTGTARVFDSGGTELLISHNTVQNFARSFLDGYPTFSEISYNLIEDGGNLSWDTGVFDADGGNGDSSYSIFHHNVIRNTTNTNGIYEGFYGRQNNAVIHHNMIYDFNHTGRPIFRSGGQDFRQAYHNTFISDANSVPAGATDALDSVQARYNNNLQLSMDRMEALGVDLQGNHNYTTSDFVDFNNRDLRLAAGSGAIDIGVVLPGINDGYLGAAPDAGAIEFGKAMWDVGHNFVAPPTPVYAWEALPGSNIYTNGQFNQGIGDWQAISGSPESRDRNSWNLATGRVSLTGTFRTQSVEFTPGEAMRRTIIGLQPNTTYTLGATARLINEVTEGDEFDGSSGSITTGTHRDVDYATGLTAGEWVRYDNIDFGELGQFDEIEILYKRADQLTPITGASIQVRLDNANGPLLAEFAELTSPANDWEHWFTSPTAFSSVSGVHSIYVSVTGGNASNVLLGNIRLMQQNVQPDDQLTATIASPGATTVSSPIGKEVWEEGYQTIAFTTGPAATTADITFSNNGRLNAYLDRIYVIEGHAQRGGIPQNVSAGGTALRSISAASDSPADGVIDGDPSIASTTGNHAFSWIQVDLGNQQRINNVQLTAPPTSPEKMSNFRVSLWSTDPRDGGHELWGRDYLTRGDSLDSGETLTLHADQLGEDGVTALGTVEGRYVRVQLLGTNNQGNNQLSIGEIVVNAFDSHNLTISDGIASQSSTASNFAATNAIDDDPTSRSATQAAGSNNWWQVRFPQSFSMSQIELLNHDADTAGELSNFSVSIWDDDPSVGGTKLWEQAYHSTGAVAAGGSQRIAGDEIGLDGLTRLASVQGRVVRVQLNGTNNAGNGTLSLANVRVTASDSVSPQTNLAMEGTADQSSSLYGISGLADDAINGVVLPLADFTSTEYDSQAWWQVDLGHTPTIDQIVVYNRVDAANRLGNFRVSVWDADPQLGGSEVWGRNYSYSAGDIPAGGSLTVPGNATSSGTRLDQVTDGRFVRVQLLGSNILSLVEVQVWTADAVLRTDSTANTFNYDVGTPDSPVENNKTRISPWTHGDTWWTGQVDSTDRGGSNSTDDFVSGSGAATLHHKVANGAWRVTVEMGDTSTTRDNMMLWAEGALINGDIDTTPAQPATLVFDVQVHDGELNLGFDDGGGINSEWVFNGLTLEQLGAPPSNNGDFNEDGNVNGLDLALWGGDYGLNADSDANSDGDTDGSDFLIWQQNYQAPFEQTTTVLIDATTGNGEFAVDEINDASSIGGGTEPLSIDVGRDRALRGTSGTGRGVAVEGWEVRRVSYLGSNAALGVDGNYGFAADAGTGPGETGQAFVNSGVVDITSATINHTFFAGDVVDLSYLLGSDSGGGTGTAFADVDLIFDEGLPTETTHSFARVSGTGSIVNADTTEIEQYTLAQAASSLKLNFQLEGGDNTSGIRGLLDRVELSVTSSGAPVAGVEIAASVPDGSHDVAETSVAPSVQLLAIPTGLPESFDFVVEAAGQVLTLQLDKHSVFGENTRFLVDDGSGELVQVDHGVDRSYLGTVVENPNYAVSAVLTPTGLYATIIRPGQTSLVIEPSAVAASTSGALGGAIVHQVFEDEAGPTQTDHDHDSDGIQDHAAEDHTDETGGGHPPGCTCAACCGESSDLPAALATLPPSTTLEVREYEVGVEIGSAALNNNYSGATVQDKVDTAMIEAAKIPGNLDARFLRAAGIKHRLGTVIIRTTSDPFTVSNGNDNAGLAAFRDYWNANPGEVGNTHDLAVYHVRANPSGLAYVNSVGTSNRYALSASNGPSSWADGTLAHEFGHSWSLGHVPGGTTSSPDFYEARPRGNGSASGGDDNFISIMHGSGTHNIGRLSTGEANQVLGVKSNKLQFGDVVSPGPVAPYGRVDTAIAFGNPITIDVIANDLDANNDVLDVQLRDTVSFQGGTISLSNDTGPGGRDEIIYTPPVGAQGTDFFHYTVVDATGRTDWGAVYVTNEGPVVINPGQTSFSYDFGTEDSPLQSGWTRVSPSTTGDINWSAPVTAIDRGVISGINDVNRDFATSSGPATFNHKLANGIWSLTMNMGDGDQIRTNMSVSVEGQLIDNDIDVPAQEFHYVAPNNGSSNAPTSFEVIVTDGELNIEVDALGGKSWVWNRLSINFVDFLSSGEDFDGNQFVDAADLTTWQAAYGQSNNADADADGDSDGSDFLAWQRAYAPGVESTIVSEGLSNGNGGLLTTTTASSDGQATTSETDLTTNDNGRALVNSSQTGDWVQIPGWRTTRVSYPGNNPAFGFDGANAVGEEPHQYAFVNSGVITLESDPIAGSFSSGDLFDLSYWVEASQSSGTATATLTFDNGGTHTFDALIGSTTAVQFSDTFQLFGDATSVTISIAMDTGVPGNQFKLDGIELNVTSAASALAASQSDDSQPAIAAITAPKAAEVTTTSISTVLGPITVLSGLAVTQQDTSANTSAIQQAASAVIEPLDLALALQSNEAAPMASSVSRGDLDDAEHLLYVDFAEQKQSSWWDDWDQLN